MFFLSHLHADIRRTRLTRRGATHHPNDVPLGLHKEYERMERIQLPEPETLVFTLQEAILRRHSAMNAQGGVSLNMNDLGTLFGGLRRHTGGTRRTYPSGGGLYPVETYVIATLIDGTTPGIFHYHPTAHALERLWGLPAEFDLKKMVPNPDYLNPSMLIVFTSVWKRSSAKYGDLSYQHALLEAGHMSENILLLATALNLQTRPYAGFNDDEIIRLLDIDEELEQPVHSITVSKTFGSKNENSDRQ
jgi:SagB-type dehydrogenase family enzyme